MSRVGITVEGGLLAADLVERIAAGDTAIPGQQAKDFGIEAARLSAEIQAAFSDIRAYWESFKRRREFSQTSPVTLTREAWVIPLLERLGYALRFQRAGAQIGGQNYALSHRAGDEENATPVHIAGWDQPLGQRVSGQRSPHALVQEYLNRSDALWGIVTNGRELRLLRNSARSSRPSYISVDLETILDGNLYNEFALVFRLLHRSRLPEAGADAQECLLERWYQQGIEEGGRVRDGLRDGVKAALEILGSGFLRHPASINLWARLEDGRLTKGELYRELLNLIYRLLFLMVAEERRILFVPDTGTSARHEVYIRWYGIGRLRERADYRPSEDGYGDLWEGLKQTFRLFREQPAAAELALSALNGELFGLTACIDLEAAAIRNDDLLDAIRQLATFEERSGRKKTGVRRRVNYAGLDVEELGSIYESLLDYDPQVTRSPPGFALAAGSERKATGSYYTPPELVRELIESALVPVMQERLVAAASDEAKEKALLSLTICDPAAGSGHFLLAAARRVGRELAILRSGEAEPAPEIYRAALRDVIRHSIYAVDKNQLAVDLCKVALWIEGHAPGLPLSFLDHRIRFGDSLIGVFDLEVVKQGTPDEAFKPLAGDDKNVCRALREQNRRERKASLGAYWAESDLSGFAERFAELADLPDGTPAEVLRKAAQYRAITEGDAGWQRLRCACDAWTAVFFASHGANQTRTAPTTADVWNSLAGGTEQGQRSALIEDLRERFHFFHWRLAFPEVFERGGFDVMLGNPPWDVLQLSEDEYFATKAPQIAILKASRRRKAIAALENDNPALWFEYRNDLRNVETTNGFVRASGRFDLSIHGKINVSSLVAELFLQTIRPEGRSGFLAPVGLLSDDATKPLFQEMTESRRLRSAVSFENEDFIFPGIANVVRFSLVTVSGSGKSGRDADLVFYVRRIDQLKDRRRWFTLSSEEFQLLNPNTRTCPIFRSVADAELTKKIYRTIPVLIDERDGRNTNPWDLEIKQNFFSHNTDSDLFLTNKEMSEISNRHVGSRLNTENLQTFLPLYEAKFVWHYDHRFGSYHNLGKVKGRGGRGLPPVTDEEHFDPDFRIEPRHWVNTDEVKSRLRALKWQRDWLLGWRDVANAKVERTVIATVIPKVASDDSFSLLFSALEASRLCCLLANLNTIVFDYFARQKVGGTHLRRNTFIQFPILPPSSYSPRDLELVTPRVLELIYTAHDLRAFAEDLDYDGPPFRWDPDRRALLKGELDAYFAYLYNLSRVELRYILDPTDVMGADYPSETFRVLKEREINDPNIGEYRTQRLVLEAWDRFAEDGTFDPARLQDPTHFDVVRRALVETRGQVGTLERERDELMELLKRSDATPLPTLFVEGESDVTILTAAWQAFHPVEPLPVTILAARGTLQMGSLAGKGAALRQLLGDRLVFALADDDREGRDLVEDGRTRRGGAWRRQSNGIHWCLLAPTDEFVRAMKRFDIPEAFWPFTIENAFPVTLRRKAMTAGAYAVEEAGIQPAFLAEPGVAKKALAAAHQLDVADDDAILYFRPPAPETKLAFAQWIAARERRDHATFAAFEPVLDGLQAILDGRLEPERTRLQEKA